MTITITQGDLLRQDDVDAIVNTVNCVGVMGKGIALQFKNKWPANYKAYKAACKARKVRLGHMFVFDSGGLAKPNFIINFPTKNHWRGKSQVKYIHEGLNDLVNQIKKLEIKSIAIPPLGCGNGGLDWMQIRSLIEKVFIDLPEIEVRLFAPVGSPPPKSMEVRTKRPRMTPGRAAILKVLDTYCALDYGLSRIEVQKLAYFLQESGEDLKLNFAKHKYGPYSDDLRHALEHMEGHFIKGLGDGVVEAEIEPIHDATEEADKYLAEYGNTTLVHHVDRVSQLIDGFQSPYGMELLATVHWTVVHETKDSSLENVVSAIHLWSEHKAKTMVPAHIKTAWAHLREQKWI